MTIKARAREEAGVCGWEWRKWGPPCFGALIAFDSPDSTGCRLHLLALPLRSGAMIKQSF